MEWFIFQIWMFFFSLAMAHATRAKAKAPPRSGLDDVKIPTQGEGRPYSIVFGSPGRLSGSHVLYYGNLELRQVEYKDQPVGYEHLLTVCLGLHYAGLDGIPRLWYKDTVVAPTLRDATAAMADGTTEVLIDAYDAFGGWRRDGGIYGTVRIRYGLSTQLEDESLQKALNTFTGIVEDLSHGPWWTPPYTVTSATFDDYADGTLVGGTYTCKGHTYAIVAHAGSTITVNGWWPWWNTGQQYTVVVPVANRTLGPAYRGIVTLLFPHAFWGFSPVLGLISWEPKRTQVLTGEAGTAQWYLAKADIGAGHDLNPAHILRECLTDTIWGDRRAAATLGDSWTTVADTLYTEGFGLSFNYENEPRALADFVDLVQKHCDAFTWENRTTGKLEIGLARALTAGELAALTEYDEDDFEVIDWYDKTWFDVPGRVVLKYSNRQWPENAKSIAYDDIAVQAKQGGAMNEEVIELKGIFEDALAAKVVNRLGRQLCRLTSIGTLRSKRTMSDLHRGSVIKFTSTRVGATAMVMRIGNLKLGPLGEDYVEIDVATDVWTDGYLINGAPDTPHWEPPPVEPDEPPMETLTATSEASGAIGVEGIGESVTASADGDAAIGAEGSGETDTATAEATAGTANEASG